MKSKQRIVNILSELVKNSLDADASDINVKIKRTDDFFVVTIQDDGKGMDAETLETVRKKLNQPIRPIYDEYYSGLTGNNHSESGLNLVGFQVDEVEVDSNPQGTTIRVKRARHKNER